MHQIIFRIIILNFNYVFIKYPWNEIDTLYVNLRNITRYLKILACYARKCRKNAANGVQKYNRENKGLVHSNESKNLHIRTGILKHKKTITLWPSHHFLLSKSTILINILYQFF